MVKNEIQVKKISFTLIKHTKNTNLSVNEWTKIGLQQVWSWHYGKHGYSEQYMAVFSAKANNFWKAYFKLFFKNASRFRSHQQNIAIKLKQNCLKKTFYFMP